jgi:hypothetical protein
VHHQMAIQQQQHQQHQHQQQIQYHVGPSSGLNRGQYPATNSQYNSHQSSSSSSPPSTSSASPIHYNSIKVSNSPPCHQAAVSPALIPTNSPPIIKTQAATPTTPNCQYLSDFSQTLDQVIMSSSSNSDIVIKSQQNTSPGSGSTSSSSGSPPSYVSLSSTYASLIKSEQLYTQNSMSVGVE